jgi:hypothetical protein
MNALTEFHPGNYIFYGQFLFTRDIFISDHIKTMQFSTTQWPREKVQKDKQRSTKHTY